MLSPFNESAGDYSLAGFFPIPLGGKVPMINDYTGFKGKWDNSFQLTTWYTTVGRNADIGIRLSPDLIAIDIDAYEGKQGAETLASLEAEYGPLPRTLTSTSRTDGVSGIRVYRVRHDTDVRYTGVAGPGIEVITWYHRHITCWPSKHEKTGLVYMWNGKPGVPDDPEITELPDEWYHFLINGAPNDTDKIEVHDPAAFMREWGGGDMCDNMRVTQIRHCAHIRDAGDAGGAHDAARDGAMAVFGDMAAGHYGASIAIGRIKTAFYKAVSSRRRGQAFRNEWDRIYSGGIELAAGRLVAGGGSETDPCVESDESEFRPIRADGSGAKPLTRFERDVKARAYIMRVDNTATHIVRAETVAPIPGLITLSELQPEDDGGFLIDGLVPRFGNTLVVAQRKAGKTTLRDNFLRSVVDGDDFLGAFEVVARLTGKVAVLDTEMYRSQMYEWLMAQGIVNSDQIVLCPLRGSAGSFAITDPVCRAEWAELLRAQDTEYLVMDCFAPACAANGLDENSNTDIGHFLMALDEMLADADIPGSMIVHHMGNTSERGRGASRIRDWADSEIHLLIEYPKDGKDDTGGLRPEAMRYIAAEGRDVAIPETQLSFDPVSRHLSVSGGTRYAEAAISITSGAIAHIRANPGIGTAAIAKALHKSPNTVTGIVNTLVENESICRHGTGPRSGLYLRANCPDSLAH